MATWKIDTNHSEIGFKVKHLVITTVSGKFKTFEGVIESDKEDFSDAKIQFSADISSIDTGNEARDGHLKNTDFFDADTHPKLTFTSKAIEKKGGNEYKVTGDLTIRGTSRPVTLDVEYNGIQKDFYGNTVAGFEISGKIDRQDFGLSWSAATETGGLVVGNDVKLQIGVEAIKQA